MSKWLLVGLAAVVVVLAVATWRGLADSDDSHPATAAKSEDSTAGSAGGSGVADKPVLNEPTGPVVQPPKPRDKVDPVQDDPAAALARFTDVVVPRELYAQVVECYDGQEVTGGKQKMEVGYRITVEGSRARVAGAKIVESNLGDRGLEDCILGKIEGHEWQVADGFEIDEQGTADFTMSGLKKLSRRNAGEGER